MNEIVNNENSDDFTAYFARNEAIFDRENANFDLRNCRYTVYLDTCHYFIEEAKNSFYPEFKHAFAKAEQVIQQVTYNGGKAFILRNLR